MLDVINKCIADMDSLIVLENRAENMQKLEAIENKFSQAVKEMMLVVDTAQDLLEKIDFKLDYQVKQSLKTEIDSLLKISEETVIEEKKLTEIRKNTSMARSEIVTSWQNFHKKGPGKRISTLNTVKSLVPNKSNLESTITRISNGYSLNFENRNNISILKSAVDDADDIIKSLHLTDEIRMFLLKVSDGNAKLSDLKPDILKWIKDNNITEKFSIGFSKF